jgi:hypothetical protein
MTRPSIKTEAGIMKARREWDKIADELCHCGARKSSHLGALNHLGCVSTNCPRFTWKAFIDKNGKVLK